LQTVREDERSHLARELHDELGGLLTAAKLDVARVRKRLAGSGPEAAERIDHLSQTLDAGIALKRRIIEDLRPSSLDNLGLPRTLEILCSDFARAADVQLSTEIAELPLRGEPALAIYRLVQEALTNIAKYARARHVQVRLSEVGGRAQVQVRDDGVGFDPSTALRQRGHGLSGMRFRMQSCGGDWLLDSAPGRGTLVQASVPL
jgi:signal transduction histidine kinase